MYIYSIRNVAGKVDSIKTDSGVILERGVPGETIHQGDWLLIINGAHSKNGKLYEVIGTSVKHGHPIIQLENGCRIVAAEDSYLHFIEVGGPGEAKPVPTPTYKAGDIVVITSKTFAMKGFEVGDVVEITPTDETLLHEYMITRFDGAVGFVDGGAIRLANEQECLSYNTRRVLSQVGRYEGKPHVNDVIEIIRGEYEGTLSRITGINVENRIIHTKEAGWLPIKHVRLVAPAEATVV